MGGRRPAPGLWVVIFGSGEQEEGKEERGGPTPVRPLAVALTDERGRFQVDVFQPAGDLALQVGALGKFGALRRLDLCSDSAAEGMILRLGVESSSQR